jgi:hypothetical protein
LSDFFYFRFTSIVLFFLIEFHHCAVIEFIEELLFL